MIQVPSDSIYFWMYEQGLKHTDLHNIELACMSAGKSIRPKDYENYWNGFHRSDLYHGPGSDDIWMLKKHREIKSESSQFEDLAYYDYPMHPYTGMPEVKNRWVPCSKDNKPMIKWSQGCMTMADCVSYPKQEYLAENLKGTQMLVIDCDGNHGDPWDWETICFLSKFQEMTHVIYKPLEDDREWPCENAWIHSPSFHLTFLTDRIIPTMHFPHAHIDIVGNRRNSLRYWKNKKWNGVQPAYMTTEIWNELRDYIKYRKEKANA